MKDDNKTKKQLVHELTELRSQNAAHEKSITGYISDRLAVEGLHRYAENIVETIRQPLLVLDGDLKIISANRNFYRTFQVTPGETIGSYIYDLGNKQWDIPRLRELLEEILPEKEAFDDFEVAHNFQDIGHKIMLLNARQIYRKDIGAKMILLAIEDITERKRLESLLEESEERFRRLFETASDGIVLLEKSEGMITHANPAIEKMLGFTKEESIGNKLQDINVLLDMGDFQTTMQNLNKSGIINYEDVPIKTKSGQHIDTDIYLVDRAKLVQCNIRDITERKQEEERVRKSEKKYRELYDFLPIPVYEMDFEANITSANRAVYETFKGTEEDLKKGFKAWQLLSPEDIDKSSKNIQRLLKGEQIEGTEYTLMKLDGSTFPAIVISSVIYSNGKPVGLRGAIIDITQRKQAEEALHDAETRYRLLFEHSPDGILIINPATARPVEFNESAYQRLGYSREEFANMSILDIEAQETSEETRSHIIKVMSEGRDDFDTRQRTKKGEIRDIHVTAQITEILGHPVYHCIWRDITDRKRMEEALRENQARLDLALRSAGMGVWHWDIIENKRYFDDQVCHLLGINPATFTGVAEEFIGAVCPDDRETIRAAMAQTIEQDVLYEPEYRAVWPDGTAHYITARGRLVRDDKGRPLRINGIIWDITERKQSEMKLKDSLDSLEKAVNTTIQVMVSVVEARDPYTSGHQIKSADLAHAIATEMKLPPDKIEGVRMAGSIHDIGKISIPAEILSKPTKLSDIEFSLIKEHARKGCEMLKDVESPWPLAEIVHQHHERMDGSGYPRNLKGEEILIEARILAIADTVEAMASHRPYRPGLGIDVALNEIEKNRGIFYDAAAADACLRLFREKGYKLERA